MWSSKVPILLLYITLFGVKKWLRVACWSIIAISAVIFLSLASYATAMCSTSGEIDLQFITNCSHADTRAGLGLGITAVVEDCLIFLLPIPTICRLALPLLKRIGLLLTFGVGAL